MKKLILLTLLCFLSFTSCKYCLNNPFYSGNSENNRIGSNIKVLEPMDLPSKYDVLLITDLHFGTYTKNTVENFLEWFNAIPDENLPAFCLSLGDQLDTGGSSEAESYNKFISHIEERNVKVFNVIGNHDIYSSGWKVWEEELYPYTSFYKFETQNISWYALDSASGLLGNKQFDLLEKEFKKDNKKKIVFSHVPVYTDMIVVNMNDTIERNQLIRLFSDNNVICSLSGHIHRPEYNSFGNYQIITVPSFKYRQKWMILTVDESTLSVERKNINPPVQFSIVS